MKLEKENSGLNAEPMQNDKMNPFAVLEISCLCLSVYFCDSRLQFLPVYVYVHFVIYKKIFVCCFDSVIIIVRCLTTLHLRWKEGSSPPLPPHAESQCKGDIGSIHSWPLDDNMNFGVSERQRAQLRQGIEHTVGV